MSEFDGPWKEALEKFFPPFLELFFRDVHAAIDWSRAHEPLDKELQQVVREAAVGRQFVDKLFKVFLRDGTEQWVGAVTHANRFSSLSGSSTGSWTCPK